MNVEVGRVPPTRPVTGRNESFVELLVERNAVGYLQNKLDERLKTVKSFLLIHERRSIVL